MNQFNLQKVRTGIFLLSMILLLPFSFSHNLLPAFPFWEINFFPLENFVQQNINDSDCDGVPDADDLCPGGDDSIDTDNDGIPDCADWDGFNNLPEEWKCGNNKVTVCHIPPGNPENAHDICINKNAVESHLDHGDYLGPCFTVTCDGDGDGGGCCFPGVNTDNTLTGDGNPDNELSVNISNDANNQLTLGTDGALYAGPDDDGDVTNELQSLSISGDQLSISSGNTVTLPDHVDDADADPGNEFNTNLTLFGTNLELTDGGGTLSVDLGNLPDDVNDADADPGNELQDLSLSGNTLSLTADPTPVDLTPYLDNTDQQALSINDDQLSISNGNTVTLPSSTEDADWYEVGSTTAPSAISDDVYTEGKVGIGQSSPDARLQVKGIGSTSSSLTSLFEKQNGERIFWMKDDGNVFVGEDVLGTSGGLLHVVSNEPNQRGIVVQNKDVSSTSAALIRFYVGSGFSGGNEGVGTLGYFAEDKKVKLASFRPFRAQASEIDLHVGNDNTVVNKSLRLFSPSGTELRMFATAQPSSNMWTKFEGANTLLYNTAINPPSGLGGLAEFRNTADSKVLQIRTFSPSYTINPSLAGKSLLSANHDFYLAPNTGFDTHIGNVSSGVTTTSLFVENTGNVGIGTTTPSEKLHVTGNVFSDGGIFITSDKRFKQDIQQLESVLEKINQLDGVSYAYRLEEFKERGFSEGTHLGLIAQNLEEVYPELVKTYEDGYKAVNYDGLIPVLIEGIKAQQADIEVLDSEKEELQQEVIQLNEENTVIQNRLDELESKMEQLLTLTENQQERISRQEVHLSSVDRIVLNQNEPNPFKEHTIITYYLPESTENAELYIFDLNGKILKKVALETGDGMIEVYASNLSSGMYSYSIVVDGSMVDTKKMVVTE